MLTIIIKTHNCEDTVSEVLESVKDLGQTVVIDEHSTDDTILLAKEYRAKIVYNSSNEFDSVFNQTLSEIENEWILFLEGDEIVPDFLGQKILNYIENPKKNRNALYLPNKLFYLNREIKASRKYELKLFKKGSAKLISNYSLKFKPDKTKKYRLKGSFKNNKNCILKFEKRNIYTYLQDSINKTILESKEKNTNKASVFLKPLLKFIFIYFIKGAILEGKKGFIYSFCKTIEIFISQCAQYEKKAQNGQ